MKHKHADVIKAWADGAQIQVMYMHSDYWCDLPPANESYESPAFYTDAEYRIKPSSVDAQPADEQTDDHTGICLEVEA